MKNYYIYKVISGIFVTLSVLMIILASYNFIYYQIAKDETNIPLYEEIEIKSNTEIIKKFEVDYDAPYQINISFHRKDTVLIFENLIFINWYIKSKDIIIDKGIISNHSNFSNNLFSQPIKLISNKEYILSVKFKDVPSEYLSWQNDLTVRASGEAYLRPIHNMLIPHYAKWSLIIALAFFVIFLILKKKTKMYSK